MSFVNLAPETASNKASSPMTLLTLAERLERLDMALSAPRLSDRSSTDVCSPMWLDHNLRATRAASASHRVVKADSPRLALKFAKSYPWMMSAKYSTGQDPRKRMPPIP